MRMKLIVLLSMAAVAAVAAGPGMFPAERTTQTEKTNVLEWEPIAEPSSVPDRMDHVTIYHPGSDRIFQIGGNEAGESGTYDGINRAYDPTTDTWDPSPAEMPVPAGWAGYGLVGNVIHIIGGFDNEDSIIAVNQAYDIVSDTWTMKAARPVAALAPLSATWRDSLIYVIGGTSYGGILQQVDIYDPAGDAWSVGTELPRGAFWGSAVILGDTIYIAQAFGSDWRSLVKGAINPADPTEITWLEGPEIEPVHLGATVAIDDDIYWLGGLDSQRRSTDMVWKYSTVTGEVTRFRPVYPVEICRGNFAAARVTSDDKEIYGMAGATDGTSIPPNRTYVKLVLTPEVGVEELPQPLNAAIESVRPSVVRDRAKVNYAVSRAGRVQLGVYDATGRLVRTLTDRTVQLGTHTATWDRTDSKGRRVANGAYFFRLLANGQAFSARVVALD